ncbi:MAG: dihydrolipoyl dehydrogenase [Candidatus Eisenbacteria bacterium]|nr:dihydrolipoyl dehydrogenase [Candidatus Eisenbacteria bacterium]
MAASVEKSYDLIVIGSGPGGYSAAIRASQLGMKTAIVEEAELGGICLNWGCIPTKALLRSAELYQVLRHAKDYGLSAPEAGFDWGRVIQRSRDVASRMNKGVSFLMKKNGIDVHPVRGKLGDAQGTVLAGEQTLRGKQVMVATGGRARGIPGVTIDGERILTYRQAMTLSARPERIVIIGAGAIGVEFAYFFNSFGTRVTLIEMLPHLLPIEDEEISKELERSFSKQGIAIRTATRVQSLARDGDIVRAAVAGPKGEETIEADVALVAIGVQGNVEEIGLEKAGVHAERGRILVDAHLRTNVPGIVAIGDVIGPPLLAHVAVAEGIHAVETIAGIERKPIDYRKVPGCTYCQPQVASIGLTEKAAQERGYEFKVGRFPVRASGKAVALGETEGIGKVLVGPYGELLGVHMIGPEATEVIAEASLAMASEATAGTILETIHAHPTMAETILEATANALGEAINI